MTMSFRTLATAAILCAAFAVTTSAQQRQAPATGRVPAAPVAAPANAAPPPPPPPAPQAPSAPNGQPVNVKIDFVITDQRGSEPPIKRQISVIAADRNLGRVRSRATVLIIGSPTPLPLDIDATPTLLQDGKIRLQFTLGYDLPAPEPMPNSGTPRVTTTSLQDSLSLVLTDGKSMVAAQSADPIGDRQVTVEVKATVLK